jgi:peptidoglycan/LPS O-acetylase OafA/YrhL
MKRDHKLDFLRAVAIILILIIHSSIRYANTEIELFVGRWFGTFSLPGVGIFLFVSGALFKSTDDINYLKRRIKRVTFPYLFFSIFAIIYTLQNYTDGKLVKVVFNIVMGNTFGIYYFIFLIIVVYLTAFILVKWNILEKYIQFILLFSLMLSILHAQYFNEIWVIIKSAFNISENWKRFYILRALPLYLPYFFFGVYYRLYNISNVVRENKSFIRGIWISVFIFYNLLYFLNVEEIYGYNSIIGTIYTLSTILLLLTLNIRRNHTIEYISKISYTMYLSHIFFVYTLIRIQNSYSIELPFWFTIVSFTLSFIGPIFIYQLGKLFFKERTYYILGA